jgi:hypothetical protein
MKKEVSAQDKEHLVLLRKNVESFMEQVSRQYAPIRGLLLDIAPQDHRGARPFFNPQVQIETLDIDAASGATHTADLCDCVKTVGIDRFDFVVCTEVLEHTRQPFDAVNSIYIMLKPGGLAFITTPFNLRIHGPLPDCWRFTEHGLRELFKDFEIISLQALECETRFLMPIQYTLVARKPISEK